MSRRAERRHHKKRVINKYKSIYRHVWATEGTEQEIDKWAKTTAGRGSISCGCVCCSNPRRHKFENGGLTIQELKAYEDAEQQIKDIQFNETGIHQ